MAENGIWSRMEDAYYSALDKIDPVLPVYRVIDPIDERIPSLALILGILALILILVLVPPLFGGGNASAIFTIHDDKGQPISNLDVQLSYLDKTETLSTNSLGNVQLKNVPLGTSVHVRASFPGLESIDTTQTITENNAKFTLTFLPTAQPAALTIQLTDTSGLSLTGKTLSVSLSCTNSAVKPNPDHATVTNGILNVTPPANCGTLLASVNGNGYKPQSSISLSGNNPIIQLDPIDVPKGKIHVRVQDAQNNDLLGSMQVELISAQSLSLGTQTTNNLGGANFNDVPVGDYYVSVSDPQHDYATQTSDTVTLNEGETQEINVEMSKSVKGTLRVHVQRKGSSATIANALVKLVRKADNKLISTKQTDSNGSDVSFAVSESGPFIIYAENEQYIGNAVETGTVNGDQTITVQMEALTAQNSGIVRIKVVDEDNVPVDNAQVVLYESGSGFIALQYSPHITDINGVAKFTGVHPNTYFARVFKFPAGPTDSGAFTNQLAVPTDKTVTLQIGVATVQVHVKDNQGNAIPFANVEFLTDGSDECTAGHCQTTADAQGAASKTFKADRKIFVRVSANTYSPTSSLSYQLFPGATQSIDVKLQRTIVGSTPQIDLVGIQELPSQHAATDLRAGKSYRVLFQLSIPTALILESGGAHVRVGDEALLENDKLAIIGTNAPQTDAVKGTSYTPPNGSTTDQANLTNADAKWVTLNWNDLPSGVYQFAVDVRVNETTAQLATLPIYYRAWGVKTTGEWVRAPADAILGTAESNGARGSLYAETYSKIYHNGEAIACTTDFCYTGEQLFNATDQLYVEGPPFSTIVNKNYNYQFVITSNTSAIYPNTKVRVYVDDGHSAPGTEITLQGYTITSTNGQQLSGQNLSTHDIPGGEGQGIETGELRQYQTISGNIQLLAETTGGASIVVQLISNGQIIFSKSSSIAIQSNDQLNINVDPNTAVAFLPTTFDVHITDAQGFDIQNALVTLRRVDPSHNDQLIQSLYSDSQGKVSMIGPPSLPRTQFVFDAAKAGYGSTPVTIVVDENIVTFEPQELQFQLPATPNASDFEPLRITNKTQTPLTLHNAQINGTFQGFLANGEMQNYVGQYKDQFNLGALEAKSLQVKAATSSTVNPVNNETLNGQLVLTFSTQGTQQNWVQRVPMHVALGLVGSCDGDAVQLSGAPAAGSIQTTAFDNKAQIQFQASNICEKDGRPFELRNLKAKLNWKSNPIGNVELSLTDLDGGQTAVEVLRQGAFVNMFDAFKTSTQTPYAGVITFTPLPGNIGKDAEFSIEIGGELAGQGGAKTVSKTFNVKIRVTNLESCVKITPEPEEGVVMKAGDSQSEFQVDTTDCGTVPVDFAFCQGANNDNCSGGAPEGRLQLSRYSIQNLTADKKTVQIQRIGSTLPGTYDVTIHARVPGTQYRQIAALTTRIESDDSYAFDLDKSQFTLYQKDAIDSATVTNKLLQEVVQVTANACDWEEASKRSAPYALAIGLGAAGGVSLAVFASATALASTGFGLAIAVIVIAIAALLDDPCSHKLTHPLNDYIINLSGGPLRDGTLAPDAISVDLDTYLSQNISASWNTHISNVFKKNNSVRQTVGVEFTNNTGFTDPNPLFGVATLKAYEHRQGDDSHSGSAAVECHNGNFGAYNIGPSSSQGSCSPATDDTVREEKFHVKIRTQDVNQTLPELQFDTVACANGSELGASGSGALPKVALNWSWNDTTGIPINACDALNGNHIYCDATQFNIVVMKRLHALDDFLAANSYQFTCPVNPLAQSQSANFPSQNPVPLGYVGLAGVNYHFNNPTSVSFGADVNNLTTTAQSVTLNVQVGTSATSNAPTLPAPCNATASINASGFTHLECTISGLAISDSYYAQYSISSSTTTNVAYGQPVVQFSTQSVQQQTNNTCDDLPKNTALAGGAPVINRWIDPTDPLFGSYVRDTSVVWTNAVPNITALNNLLHFDAYLVRDGYSADFENDFRDYYTQSAFADAPTWFKATNPTTSAFSKYYAADDHLKFTNKYFDSVTLPAAGKYHVDLDVDFGNEWKFFDAQGNPRAQASVVFYHLANPSPNSPFYRMPFDGPIGLAGTQYDRVGYGLEYLNDNNPIKLNDSTVLTYPGGNSSALASVEVKVDDDIRKLNGLPSSRGNLLQVTAASGSGAQQMVFTPTYATPIMMRVTQGISPNPFHAFYQIAENGAPVQAGNTLTFWEGAGNCYDYSGVPVYEKFNFTPDRAATPQDAISAWQYTYGVDWDRSLTSGNEWLRTIFYTPAGRSFSLLTTGSNAKLLSANYSAPSNVVPLDGISTLPYNNSSLFVDSVQDLFDLVGQQKVCISDSGVSAKFFWNPTTIYNQTSQTSIHAQTQGLVAGQTCLGAPPQ